MGSPQIQALLDKIPTGDVSAARFFAQERARDARERALEEMLDDADDTIRALQREAEALKSRVAELLRAQSCALSEGDRLRARCAVLENECATLFELVEQAR